MPKTIWTTLPIETHKCGEDFTSGPWRAPGQLGVGGYGKDITGNEGDEETVLVYHRYLYSMENIAL